MEQDPEVRAAQSFRPSRSRERALGNLALGQRGRAALTTHELNLLQWLCAGQTNAQIGRALGRSEKTIRNQLTRLYEKLEAANRAHAVAVYLRIQSS